MNNQQEKLHQDTQAAEFESDSLMRLTLARVLQAPLRAGKNQPQENKEKKVSRLTGIVLCGVLLVTAVILCIMQGGAATVGSHSIIISEVMSQNVCAICDENGNFYDYIELYNSSDEPVNLKGMGLSDQSVGAARYVFENVELGAGQSVIVFCQSTLPFSLKSSGGETIRLVDAGGSTVARVDTLPMNENEAMVFDGETYQVTDVISPGFANDEQGVSRYLESKTNETPVLVISELATENMTLMGTNAQCVELQNISDAPIELSDYALSDDVNDLFRFVLPEGELLAGETIVYTFGDDAQDASFGFSDGEQVYLSDLQGVVQCQAPVCTQDNTSIVLAEDAYALSDAVSLGYPNTEDGIAEYQRAYAPDGVIITEVVADNSAHLVRGGYYDYIELYNAGEEAVNLCDYSLSDDNKEPDLVPLGDFTLAAGEYIVFACNGDLSFADYDPASGILPLGISKDGEGIGLYCSGAAEDYVTFPQLNSNAAYGRTDDMHTFAYLSAATPAAANAQRALTTPAAPIPDTAPGAYDDVESITVNLSGEGVIRYTLDCTEPGSSDPVWEGPMELSQTTVIRARSYVDGCAPGEEFTATYLINEGHTMDVACLVSDPGGLFSSSYGIYATGYGAAPESPHFGANYWMRWEREAQVSLYSDDGGFSLPCGVRIFGGFSRSFGQKSLSILFRDRYGAAELNYPLFGEDGLDSYEAFVFRSTGQDVYRAHMRDALITTMYDELLGQTTVQDSRPVVLYINGQYWGVYFIREKINEHFIAGKYNVDADTATILFQKGYGNAQFQNLVNYARTHDLSQQEHFDYVASQINIESYVNYLIAQMYSSNFDIGNVRYFSSPQYDDGRWNWILYDVDWAFSFENDDCVRTMLSSNIVYSADLIQALLENDEFKDWFLREFARQLNEVWSEENVNAYLDEFVQVMQPEMQRECSRWGWRYSTWENQVEDIRTFAHNRPKNMYNHIRSYFGLTHAQMEEYGFVR